MKIVKVVTLLAILLIGLSTSAMADTPVTPAADTTATDVISNLKVNGFAIWNLDTKTMQYAPGLTYPVFSFVKDIFLFNVGAVVPVTNTGGTTSLKVGPVISLVVNKLAANVTGITWLAPKGVEVGGGVLIDAIGITKTGASLKTCAFPAVWLKIYSF